MYTRHAMLYTPLIFRRFTLAAAALIAAIDVAADIDADAISSSPYCHVTPRYAFSFIFLSSPLIFHALFFAARLLSLISPSAFLYFR